MEFTGQSPPDEVAVLEQDWCFSQVLTLLQQFIPRLLSSILASLVALVPFLLLSFLFALSLLLLLFLRLSGLWLLLYRFSLFLGSRVCLLRGVLLGLLFLWLYLLFCLLLFLLFLFLRLVLALLVILVILVILFLLLVASFPALHDFLNVFSVNFDPLKVVVEVLNQLYRLVSQIQFLLSSLH